MESLLEEKMTAPEFEKLALEIFSLSADKQEKKQVQPQEQLHLPETPKLKRRKRPSMPSQPKVVKEAAFDAEVKEDAKVSTKNNQEDCSRFAATFVVC